MSAVCCGEPTLELTPSPGLLVSAFSAEIIMLNEHGVWYSHSRFVGEAVSTMSAGR